MTLERLLDICLVVLIMLLIVMSALYLIYLVTGAGCVAGAMNR